jgi:translation initiation factor IF-1
MPGVTARSATKNMSRSKRGAAAKNVRRVEAAMCEVEEYALHATYGKVTKALGNKMFTILSMNGTEHLAHIRGKMVRVAVDDIVLLNIRDYESRSSTSTAVYDIIALFSSKDVSKLIRSEVIPKWMGRSIHASDDEDDAYDLFDFEEGADDDDDNGIVAKKDKKNHRIAKDDDAEVDIDGL